MPKHGSKMKSTIGKLSREKKEQSSSETDTDEEIDVKIDFERI